MLLLVSLAAAADDKPVDMSLQDSVLLFGLNYRTANTDMLAQMLTADYVHINGGSGNVNDRDAWLSWVRSQRTALDAGTLVVDAYEIKDYQQRIYGDTAFVTGVVESSGSKEGAAFKTKIRFSNVWVKKDGRWLRAAFHDSPLE